MFVINLLSGCHCFLLSSLIVVFSDRPYSLYRIILGAVCYIEDGFDVMFFQILGNYLAVMDGAVVQKQHKVVSIIGVPQVIKKLDE
jgi:uncharacterized membrane protein YccF (DUF307 family)